MKWGLAVTGIIYADGNLNVSGAWAHRALHKGSNSMPVAPYRK